MINYVLGFLYDRHGIAAMIKKNKPEWQAGLFNGIGGKVEEGETSLQAMIREFEEETGVLIKEWYILGDIRKENEFKVDVYFREVEDIKTYDIKTTTEEEVVVKHYKFFTFDNTVPEAYNTLYYLVENYIPDLLVL